jgi:HAD superfamily hydrolase (TIGR01450 family)
LDAPSVLQSSPRPLVETHDALLVDLDGVVQLDDQPVPGAPDVLGRVRDRGLRVAFITNNAARAPEEVAARLSRLGVEAAPTEVVTSSMAAADVLAAALPPGAEVLVIGGPGLWAAIAGVGLQPVRSAESRPPAVAQGWGPDVAWRDLAEGAVALRAGARWVVTNRDATLPSPRGPLPGSGSLVAALVTATGLEPADVVGKPGPSLFEAARRRTGAERPLVVGDRLDTDIAGAVNAGMPSLVVLTGVSRPLDLLSAEPPARPSYLGRDIAALEIPHPPVAVEGERASCGQVTVTSDGIVKRSSASASSGDGLDGLRAACVLAWRGVLDPDRFDGVLRDLDLA